MNAHSMLKPVFAPVCAYVEIPPASLSATIVMMPGPMTARRISVRRLSRASRCMDLLIQYMVLPPEYPGSCGPR